MEEQMIGQLLVFFTHVAPIQYAPPPPFKLLNCQNSMMLPNLKKATFVGT